MQNTPPNKDDNDNSDERNKSPKMAKPVVGEFKRLQKKLVPTIKSALKTQAKPRKKQGEK